MSADYENAAFSRLVKHPFKFRLFLLGKLPSAYFSGVRVKELDEGKCVVTIPYKWFSRNPFRCTYFACLAMAGEMSTGALGMSYLYKRTPSVSMLVVNIQGEFYKKATGTTVFVCEDGNMFSKMIGEAISTGEVQTVKARSVGKNRDGEIVAEFFITWTFKVRS